jgi:phage terminase large subunit
MAKSNYAMQTAGAFVPLLKTSRYKGAHGGPRLWQSHLFAGLIIEHCLAEPSQNKGEGLRVVCIREQFQVSKRTPSF